MRSFVVLLLAVAGASVAEAEDAPTPALPPEPEISATQRFVDAARTIPMKAPAGEVERLTAAFGKPELRFAWCTRAGCVDVSEQRATRMTAYWSADSADAGAMLAVSFCGGVGEWRVGSVAVMAFPAKAGAWGTAPKGTSAFKRTDDDFFYDTCWQRR